MEHAPLRPVPARPAGPIDPAAASGAVASALPGLDAVDAQALALVALAELPRARAAVVLGIASEELAETLAHARKELRRTLARLPGSGWCERAERAISDRLDGALGATRGLDIHLRNCPRCVEHERRLVQATDALVSTAYAVSGAFPLGSGAQPAGSHALGAGSGALAPDTGDLVPAAGDLVPDDLAADADLAAREPAPVVPLPAEPVAHEDVAVPGPGPDAIRQAGSAAGWLATFTLAWLSVLVVVILGAAGVL